MYQVLEVTNDGKLRLHPECKVETKESASHLKIFSFSAHALTCHMNVFGELTWLGFGRLYSTSDESDFYLMRRGKFHVVRQTNVKTGKSKVGLGIAIADNVWLFNSNKIDVTKPHVIGDIRPHPEAGFICYNEDYSYYFYPESDIEKLNP